MRDVPASYRPRSKRLPSKSEKTLWKKGSRLGNSTCEPASTTRICGSKLLFFCTRRGTCVGLAGFSSAADHDGVGSPPVGSGVSHTTVRGSVPCLGLPPLAG